MRPSWEGKIIMNQHCSQESSRSVSPARENNVDTALASPNTNSSACALSLQELKGRYAQWGKCKCPKEFQENYRPYKTDYIENQCLICGNLSGRKYD